MPASNPSPTRNQYGFYTANPTLKRKAAEYLQAIGTPDTLPSLCEALLRGIGSPHIGSSNIANEVQAKIAIVRAIEQITALSFAEIDLSNQNQSDLQNIVDRTMRWRAEKLERSASETAKHTPPQITGNDSASKGGDPENRYLSTNGSVPLSAPGSNQTPIEASQFPSGEHKEGFKSLPISMPIVPLIVVGIGLLVFVIYLSQKNKFEPKRNMRFYPRWRRCPGDSINSTLKCDKWA